MKHEYDRNSIDLNEVIHLKNIVNDTDRLNQDYLICTDTSLDFLKADPLHLLGNNAKIENYESKPNELEYLYDDLNLVDDEETQESLKPFIPSFKPF